VLVAPLAELFREPGVDEDPPKSLRSGRRKH
jgi:hypothetical protein